MRPRLVPGIHSVLETLSERPKSIKQITIREGELKGDLDQILKMARSHQIPVKRVNIGALDKIHAPSQGVIAEVNGRPEWNEEHFSKVQHSLVYALDSLEDPHNLGSILRTTWTLGGDGIVIPKDRSVGLTPAVEKISSGAVDHIPVLEVTNLVQTLKDLKEQGFWVYGLTERATKKVFETEFAHKTVLVVGSESSGLRAGVIETCDELVKIPQASGAHNLNAAMAAGIVGYEVIRQRQNPVKNTARSQKNL